MGLTLGEVLRFPILENAEILVPAQDPTVQVRGINVMEAHDIMRWVQPDIILLTSLYAVYKDEDKMKYFLASLTQSTPCAIVVKVGRFVETVPEVFLAVARQLAIPILKIPLEVHYTDIIYPVMAAVLDSQVIQLSTYKKTHNLLAGYALKNAGIEGITSAFAHIVDNPAVVYDQEMTPLFSTHPGRDEGDMQLLDEYNEQGLHYITMQHTHPAGQQSVLHLMPFHVLDRLSGYLGVIEANHPLTELDFIAMQNATTVLNQEMLKDFAVREVARSFRLEIIDDILCGRVDAALMERANAVGLYAETEYLTACIECHTPQQHVLQQPHKLVDDRRDRIESVIRSILQRAGMNGTTANRKQRTALFLQRPQRADDISAVEAVLNTLRTELERVFGNCSIGYCGHFVRPEAFAVAYANAISALKAGHMLGNNCTNYDTLGVFKLLGTDETRRLEEYLPTSLKRLLAHDGKNNGALVHTLRTYFACNRNAKAAAEQLYIHNKTMSYRLKQIAHLAPLDIKNPQQMLEMELGLQLFDGNAEPSK